MCTAGDSKELGGQGCYSCGNFAACLLSRNDCSGLFSTGLFSTSNFLQLGLGAEGMEVLTTCLPDDCTDLISTSNLLQAGIATEDIQVLTTLYNVVVMTLFLLYLFFIN